MSYISPRYTCVRVRGFQHTFVRARVRICVCSHYGSVVSNNVLYESVKSADLLFERFENNYGGTRRLLSSLLDNTCSTLINKQEKLGVL